MSTTAVGRRGQFSSGLVATSGGLARTGDHPGPRPSQRPHCPSSEEACENTASNATDSQRVAAVGRARVAKPAARHAPAPVGRRHLDPHHFTNLSDEAKRQEGRLGRAHVRAPHSGPTHRTPLDAPAGQTDGRRARNRSLDTSVQLAESRLRRIAAGKEAADGDADKRAAYQQAAKAILDQYRGDAALVEQARVLVHRIASDAFASTSAQRQAAVQDSMRRRFADQHRSVTPPRDGHPDGNGGTAAADGAVGALGSPAPALQSSTPFALSDSLPRPDTNTSVTGAHGIRISKFHNSDHFPIDECAGRGSEGMRAATEEARRQGNEKYFAFRGLKAGRPYDDATTTEERYPTPPPVGVSVGIYQKPLMTRRAPGHRRDVGPYSPGEDRDSLALKRARAHAGGARSNVESSPSVDRPEHCVPRTESPQRQRHAPATLRERTEARWKKAEAEREGQRTGRALVGSRNQHTALW